jgi:8-oxo-dGTP pyrophosphatase MutT (NUDIX family)
MDLIKLLTRLENRLKDPLPGWKSHKQMASLKRLVKLQTMVIPSNARVAGVLVLLYCHGEEVSIVFMKRVEDGGVHSGQISFPGGKAELEDKDIIDTALREANEEIGVDPKQVTVIGKLSEIYIPPSNFRVTPVLAYTNSTPLFVSDPNEVAEVIEVPLSMLIDKSSASSQKIRIGNTFNMTVPCYIANGQTIWGATAMMLSELLDLIRE